MARPAETQAWARVAACKIASVDGRPLINGPDAVAVAAAPVAAERVPAAAATAPHRSLHPAWNHQQPNGMARSMPSRQCSKEGELPVFLNIYDVSNQDAVKVLNNVMAHWLAPDGVKLGAFHTGVEVGGVEWSYGRTYRDSRPGIVGMPPRSDPHHSFRQMVNAIISEIIEDYPGQSYDVLRHNCCHFAEDFCQRLGVESIPDWVHRLARLGAGADEVLQTFFGSAGCGLPKSALPSSLASISHGSGAGNAGLLDESGETSPTWQLGVRNSYEPPEIAHAALVKDHKRHGRMAPL
eukprot:TRINITY_DN9587_c0_g1_i1.p1 TRINITY_DN9587_c0_g1~~TRINITY_DN9587_c0_g1_i1.p1  ORF type:complete len:295 (+),score=35.05 TRINITY_DN9587_c0_g1_i1:88-972(+)